MQYMSDMISVIVPVFNAVDCLPMCLECLIRQTYPNLEIILVDDGSTDGSGRLCDEFAIQDSRIRVIHKGNGGVSSARNAGLLSCKGKYIGFVDADDRIDRTMFEKLMKSIEGADRNDVSDMACCGYYNYPMDTLDVKIANGIKQIMPCSPEEAVFYFYESEGYFNAVWNKIYDRRVVFQDVQPLKFDERYYVGEDEVWLSEILMRCKKIAFVPEPLYYWMPHAGSATRSKDLTEKKMSVLDTKMQSLKILPQDEYTQSFLRAVMFKDCHPYKVIAYCSGDKRRYKQINEVIEPMKHDWLKHDQSSRMNRIKVLLLEYQMRIHFPKRLVRLTSSLRRYGVKKY